MEAAPKSQSTACCRIRFPLAGSLSVLLALASGLALRLWMLKQFFNLDGDPLIYGDLAKNLLLHGSYALTGSGGALDPSLIRLPGYPLFLALCFRLFGMENYVSAAWMQIGLELAGCLLLADFARRIAPVRLKSGVPGDGSLSLGWKSGVPGDGSLSLGWSTGAAHCTLWLAALCPFTAVYAAEPLTEGLTLFAIALALWSAARFRVRPGWAAALAFTFAVTFAALLRPDGALVAVALAPALLIGLGRKEGELPSGAKAHGGFIGFMRGLKPPPPSVTTLAAGAKAHVIVAGSTARLKSCPDTSCSQDEVFPQPGKSCPDTCQSKFTACKAPHLTRMAVVCVLLALMPFAAWSWRNWRVFHVFQPLAPRQAINPGEISYPGWERWGKTWCVDFVSTSEIFWNIPGNTLEMDKLPSRAFDSPAQQAETARLAADYNLNKELTPEIDARFGRLADERIAAHPLRSTLWLPLGRMADMWLRPRVENLPIELDWWNYGEHKDETCLSWAYAGLNALYLLLGVAGLCLRPRFSTPRSTTCPWGPRFWRAMLAYMLLRSALLTTIAAPEARYTLECFPMLFALGGVALYRFTRVVLLVVFRVKTPAGKG